MLSLSWLFCLSITLASSLANLNPLEQEGPEVGCLDHSDCTQLGHKFGCLIYRCVDHSHTRVQSCHSAQDCQEGWDCILTLLPGYPGGLCVPHSSLLACADSSCSCCGQHCCPPHYQSQWADMKCVSHQQCRTWATGQFCCQDGRCCDHSPDEEDSYNYNYNYNYQYQYDYFNYSDYTSYDDTTHSSYVYTTTANISPDNSSDLEDNEDLEEDIFPRLINETTTESAENDYNINNSSDLFEDIEPGLVNETSEDYYYENTNSSELFEDAEVILSGLGNETTAESAENDYDITNSSEVYQEEISPDDADEVADVEIVTIDKTDDEEKQEVKETTFYETFNKSSAQEKLSYDSTEENDEHLVTKVIPSVVENLTRDDVYYSGSGDVSEDLSVENLNDEELTDGLQIENFPLETDEREMSTVLSESSLEISLKYEDGWDDLQEGSPSEFDVDLQVETSGSGEQLWLEEEIDFEGSGSEMFDEITNISQTYEDEHYFTETPVSAENLTVVETKSEVEITNDLDISVEEVEVVKKPTNLVGQSTNEVAWKSDAIRKTISVSVIILVILNVW